MKKAIILYGPPGSGKGTQAELITHLTPTIHFDSGRFIRSLIFSPDAVKDPILRREKKLNEAGKLNTPSWILGFSKAAGRNAAALGISVVYSGSPRTIYEAFDNSDGDGLLKELSKAYGKKNVFIIELVIKEKTSIKRNVARYVCSVCGLPRLATAKTKQCSFCAGPFQKRKDDNVETLKARLKEYFERTVPIIAEAKKQGYIVQRVNGEKLPFEIYRDIKKILGFK
jgi:adenylate kinase